MAKPKNHYVDNTKMYEALCEFYNKVSEAEKQGKEKPRIPDYIGKCFMLISNKLATRPNFIGYSYKEEMVSDAIENCIMAVGSFNPQKGKNPFAYFTQIIYFAFLRRIAKEKRQELIKNKSLQQMFISGEFATSRDSEFNAIDPKINTDYMNNMIATAEAAAEKKKKAKVAKAKKAASKGLEQFYEE